MNIKSMKVLAFSVGAALALTSGVSMAESQYGYNAAGTGTVTAQATVKLSVTVPKLILLKVGGPDTGTAPATAVQDTLSWTATISIPGVPTTPTTGNNTGVNWSGAAPTVTAGTQPGAVSVAAWTNGTGATINCGAPTWTPATGGPVNGDFTVAVTGTLPHPGANLGACASTAIPVNSLASGTWAYTLTGTPSSWTAGAYTTSVLYTATAL